MTFRDYIRAIISTKIFIGGQEQFLIDLFKHAGALKPVERDTAKSWIAPVNSSRCRNCKIRIYFPNDTLNETDFIKFISCRANNSWTELQKAFCSISKDCIVNLDTNDREIFYWSLLNQFQKIHKLPITEIPAKKMVKLFESAVKNCELSAFFEDAANFSDDADESGRIEAFLKTLQSDIIEPFQLCQNESSMYQKILELHYEMDNFITLHKLEINNLMSYYRSYYDTIKTCRQRINTLYYEISKIHRPLYMNAWS